MPFQLAWDIYGGLVSRVEVIQQSAGRLNTITLYINPQVHGSGQFGFLLESIMQSPYLSANAPRPYNLLPGNPVHDAIHSEWKHHGMDHKYFESGRIDPNLQHNHFAFDNFNPNVLADFFRRIQVYQNNQTARESIKAIFIRVGITSNIMNTKDPLIPVRAMKQILRDYKQHYLKQYGKCSNLRSMSAPQTDFFENSGRFPLCLPKSYPERAVLESQARALPGTYARAADAAELRNMIAVGTVSIVAILFLLLMFLLNRRQRTQQYDNEVVRQSSLPKPRL